jgi:hypothetical protein
VGVPVRQKMWACRSAKKARDANEPGRAFIVARTPILGRVGVWEGRGCARRVELGRALVRPEGLNREL